MPQLNDEVKIKFGLKSAYTGLSPKDQSTLYFCTDTGEIFVGDVPFSSQVLTEVPESEPDNANAVLNWQVIIQVIGSLADEINQHMQNIRPQLLPNYVGLADGTYMQISNQTWKPQPISDSDYTANRLRGIAVYDTAADADGKVPDGCFAAILSL